MSLVEAINNAFSLIDPKNQDKPTFPHLTIPPYGQRSEGSADPYRTVICEPRPDHLPQPSINGSAVSFCNHPASPHTPMQFELNGVRYPSHIVVWWYKEKDGPNEYPTIIDLSQMETEARKPFLEAIANQISDAVLFLKAHNPQINLKDIHRHIEIYGLGGHTKPEERKTTGLSRGAQSHPMGHLNVVYHPNEEYKKLAEKRPVNYREFLKHIGPMDSVVFDRWERYISSILKKIISKNNIPQPIVTSVKTHKIGEKNFYFYEGFTIEFSSSQNLVSSLEILCQVIGFFQGIYEILRTGYDQYYQHIGNKKEELSEIKKVMFNNLKSFFSDQLPISEDETPYFDKFFMEIVDFALSFHPTYQQLRLWQNSANVSQDTKTRLIKMQETYEKIQKISKDPEKEQRLVKWLQRFYGFSPFEAKAYLQFFYDMTSPTAEDQWKDIQFTWAGQLSTSYLIDRYTIDENGSIQINALTITSRFLTNKGAVEDLAGMVIDRPQGV